MSGVDLYTQYHRPSGLRLLATLMGHDGEIRRLAWSPDGRFLASPSSDHTVRIWDTETGRAIHVLTGHAGTVYCVAWSPDGRLLASGSADTTIRIWDTGSGKLADILQGHTYWVNALAWFPSRTLASASEDKAILIWDLKRRKPSRRLMGHTNAINTLVWSPDGRLLASGSGDKTARVWSTRRGTGSVLLDHPDWVISVAWSPDGKTLASACWDGRIRHWDVKTGRELRTIIGHTSRLTSLTYSFDGLFLASKGSDDSVRLWRCDNWQQVALIHEPSSGRQSPSISFHPHELLLATLGRKETTIRLWSLDARKLLAVGNSHSESTTHQGAIEVDRLIGTVATRISVWGSDDLELLVSRVETASTSDDKGRRLEELCSRLFETIEGFTVTERIRTATEEIDILILNNSTEARLRRELPLILVECKNWSGKCGKNEFVVFRAKLENRKRRCSLGFLVSWNGFADTFTSEMLRGSREETLVVPITGEEIRAAVRDDNFSKLLNVWWDRAVTL